MIDDPQPAQGERPLVPDLPTGIPGVELRQLSSRDAPALFNLVARSRAHLTQFGDYAELATATLAELQAGFSEPPGPNLRMGIWRGQELMGEVDLNPVAPRTYVLGYWIGAEYTGHGYMTAACQALMDYARRELHPVEFWAGVRQANRKSVALVERLGFSLFEELPTHNRYRLQC